MVKFAKCDKELHPFIMISSHRLNDALKVVRWCPACGCIVVDLDYDGKANPGYYRKIEYPQITEEHYNS